MSTKVTQAAEKTLYSVLVAIAAAHFLNDWIQALVPSMYPIFKDEYHLTFSQIGWLTFVFQCTASLLQPLIGFYTDKYPKPFSQVIGMFFSLSGIVMLAYTHSYGGLLVAVSLIGMGSAVFHPESARVSFIAAGKRRGLAQSIFQIGGNLGTAFGPLTIAWFVVGHGQRQVLVFIWVALAGMALLTRIAFWYRHHIVRNTIQQRSVQFEHHLSKKQVKGAVFLLLVIIFSKFFYTASISSYYTFYLMDQFSLTIQQAQFHLFLYLAAYAVGTMLGGPLGDRFGRKWVIGFSVFGAAPFTLLLPYVNLWWTDALMIAIGLIISSAFPAILVYAQELMPKKLGMVSGLFYGLAFGMAAMGSAIMGHLADMYSIEMVYRMAAFFPLIGGVFYFLPNLKAAKKEVTAA